jgi:hypothetical protein
VSRRLKASPSCSELITAEETEMPRSTAIQSERTRRRSPHADCLDRRWSKVCHRRYARASVKPRRYVPRLGNPRADRAQLECAARGFRAAIGSSLAMWSAC